MRGLVAGLQYCDCYQFAIASGAIGVIEGSTSVQPAQSRRIEIHGKNGTVVLDGEKIRLGENELTARITPGHTPGCTSWSFPVKANERELDVVHICGLTPPMALELGEYPEIRKDYEYTFKTLRSLKPDIFTTPHARKFGRWRKYQESLKAKDPVKPFIDPEGYLEYIDDMEKRYREAINGS